MNKWMMSSKSRDMERRKGRKVECMIKEWRKKRVGRKQDRQMEWVEAGRELGNEQRMGAVKTEGGEHDGWMTGRMNESK